MTISQNTQELLKTHAGRGVSNDPELLLRSKVRLLQAGSTKPKHGRGEAGLYCLPDESQTCTSKLRAILGAVYSIHVERTPDDKPTGREHFVVPAEAVRDGYRWVLPNKNVIETEARLGRPVQRRRGRARPGPDRHEGGEGAQRRRQGQGD